MLEWGLKHIIMRRRGMVFAHFCCDYRAALIGEMDRGSKTPQIWADLRQILRFS